jgi:integrase
LARPSNPTLPPTIYLRGRTSYISWHEDGHRSRRSLGEIEPELAEKVRAAKERELADAADAREAERRFGVKIFSSAPTLREFVEDVYIPALDAGRANTSTARYSLARILAELGDIQMDKLKPVDVERYKIRRLNVAKSGTVDKEIRMLKAAIRRAIALEIIDRNPIQFVKSPRVVQSRAPRSFTLDELQMIYASADKYAAVWKFAANTGLRRAELAKARRCDVVRSATGWLLNVNSDEHDRREGPEEVRNQTTKSRKCRSIPLNEAAVSALNELGDDLLAGLTVKGLDKAWERIRRRTGLNAGMHSLRHTFGTHLAMSGTPLSIVQKLMGHSTIKMTEIYTHVADASTVDAVNSISLYVLHVPEFLFLSQSANDRRCA